MRINMVKGGSTTIQLSSVYVIFSPENHKVNCNRKVCVQVLH